MRAIVFCFLLAVSGMFVGCAGTKPPVATVPKVDLSRYSGRWYEIAKYPNWFQRNCAGDTIATYTPQPDGSVRVVNACARKDGRKDEIVGRAKAIPGSHGTKLKVSFFGPFAGDYWVIGLDEADYRWAVVGHPSRRYLWILSRTPKISEDAYAAAVKTATDQGYDAARIVKTPQNP